MLSVHKQRYTRHRRGHKKIFLLDEFFQILTLTELRRKSAPIVLFNINGFYDDLISFIYVGIEKGFIREGVRELFHVCNTAPEAMDMIEKTL